MTKSFRLAVGTMLMGCFAVAALAENTAANDFKLKCAACHGADGTAQTPMGRTKKIVSLKDPSMIKLTDQQLFDSTKNGKNTMPAYAGKLTDAQITDIVAYMRTLQK